MGKTVDTTSTATIENTEAKLEERYGYEPAAPAGESKTPQPEYASPEPDDDDEPSESDETPAAGLEPAGDAAAKTPPEEPPKKLAREDWADYGLTEEQAKRLGEKGELESVLDLYDQRIMRLGQASADQQAAAQKPPVPPELKAAQDRIAELEKQLGGTGSQKQGGQAAGPFKLDFDPAQYEEGTVKVFSSLQDHANQQIARLQQIEQVLSGVTEQLQAQHQAVFVERMDGYFNSLGDEYADLVGKGTIEDLKPDSPQFKTRSDITNAMMALRTGYERNGMPVPRESVLRQRATRMVLGERTQELARKAVAEQARNAQGQFIAKPTHREGQQLTGAEKADKRLDDFYRRKGLL
jgi:molybdopterin converting factor small subunit